MFYLQATHEYYKLIPTLLFEPVVHRRCKADYEFIDSILNRFQNDRAMNLEERDGFFATLVCSPEFALPSHDLL